MVQNALNRLSSLIKPLIKPVIAVTLVMVLVLGFADSAWAARGGGRIGGGGFRAPSRTYSTPRSYRSPAGGGYYPGGGLGFPFLLPLFGMGGGFGGLFTLLLFWVWPTFWCEPCKMPNRAALKGGETIRR